MMLRRGFLFSGLALASCSPSNAPASKKLEKNEDALEQDDLSRSLAISVLIDCSGTWLRDPEANRNSRLLRAVSDGIVEASETFDKLIVVRWHIIGSQSLGREPICEVRYEPALIAQGKGDVVRKRAELLDYLSFCQETTLHLPPETRTELDYSLQTAIEANALFPTGAGERFIVLSDFKQEPRRAMNLKSNAMAGIDTLLLYRTLPEDQIDPAGRDARIETVADALKGAGARSLVVAADNSVSGEAVATFLKNGG